MPGDNFSPIIIVGGGLAGLTTALMLAKNGQLVTVLDQGGGTADTLRTTTLNPAAMAALEPLGVIAWMRNNNRPLTAMTAIEVSDEKQRSPGGNPSGGAAPDRLLGWQAETPLAQVARNSDLVDAVTALVGRHRHIRRHKGVSITDFSATDRGHAAASLTDADGKIWRAGLVIACDGAASPLRTLAGIRTLERNPGQTAIVADIRLARPHRNLAWQRFLTGGPVALMPLDDPTMASLVWTLRDADADTLMKADPAAFGQSLSEAAAAPFGELSLASERRHWSLRLRHAIRPYGPRLALVGDAAHAIHPLAGQGFNLAIGDMTGLAAALDWAEQSGSDPGSTAVLARYARGRLVETAAMTLATDGLNALFSFAPAPMRSVAGAAMTVLDRSGLKDLAMLAASGGLNRRG